MDGGLIMVSWMDFWSELQTAFTFVQTRFVSALFNPWGLVQLLILLALYGAAVWADRLMAPRLEERIRALDTTRRRLKFLALLLRRLRRIFFVIATWITLWVMQAITWPSRSYLIGVAASLATVWLVVSVAGRLVANPLISRLLVIAAWSVAVVQILGMTEIALTVLDSAAVSFGDFRLSLLTLVKSAALLGALLVGASFLARFTEQRVSAMTDLSPSMRVLTGKTVRIALFAIAAIIGLQSIGLDLTTLTVFSGAIGLGIGFGLQKVVSNFISGILLLLDKSVKPGDVIEVGDTFGAINNLGGRYVSVVTRDGREYLIPNEDLITNQVINWSHSDTRVRLEVEFGVSYEADPLTVRKLAIEAATQPKRVLAVPNPVCHLVEYGESSVNYVLRFWITDPSVGVVNIRSEVLISLWYALKEADISIPYPRRDLEFTQPVRVQVEPSPDEKPAARPRARRTPRSKPG